MKGTQKSLLASGVSLLASAALLAGTTFAWFTDSVVNTGNKIQAGNLSIGAYAYDLAEDGEGGFEIEGVNGGNPFKFETEGQDLKTDKNPIISDTLFEPGKSSAKLLKVENEGTLAAKIKLDFTVEDGGLTEALWFDFVKVENGEVKGNFTRRPMNTLETFADNLELPLLENGDNVQFILVYGMDENAGNAFKDKSFTADVAILATQYTKEEDGFGNDQYDKDALLPTAIFANAKTVTVTPETAVNFTVEDNTVYYFEAGEYTSGIQQFFSAQKNIALIANGEVVVNGSMTVGYHSNHGKNVPEKPDSTLWVDGFTVKGELKVSSIDGEVVITNNSAAQITLTSYKMDGMNITVQGNTVDGSLGTSSQQYGLYIVPENADYNLTVRGNSFVNIGSHAICIQGTGQGGDQKPAGRITVAGNRFESWGTNAEKDNRAAFKIWGDPKLAPEEHVGTYTGVLTDAARELVKQILASGNTYSGKVEGKNWYFDFYGCYFDQL